MKRPVTIPKWVYRYPAIPSEADFKQLERKVIGRYLKREYTQLLTRYNTFYTFNWMGDPSRKIVDTDYSWRQFSKRCNGQLYSLKSRLNTKVFDKCIGVVDNDKSSIIPSGKDIRAAFQSVSILEQILLEFPNNSDLQLSSVGVRIGNTSVKGISEIEPLLEEAQTKYKNLDYKKLLAIAKQSQTSSQEGAVNRLMAKQFLEKLAKQKIMHPSTTADGQWLLFTRDGEDAASTSP